MQNVAHRRRFISPRIPGLCRPSAPTGQRVLAYFSAIGGHRFLGWRFESSSSYSLRDDQWQRAYFHFRWVRTSCLDDTCAADTFFPVSGSLFVSSTPSALVFSLSHPQGRNLIKGEDYYNFLHSTLSQQCFSTNPSSLLSPPLLWPPASMLPFALSCQNQPITHQSGGWVNNLMHGMLSPVAARAPRPAAAPPSNSAL